jgi:hypothetical protein
MSARRTRRSTLSRTSADAVIRRLHLLVDKSARAFAKDVAHVRVADTQVGEIEKDIARLARESQRGGNAHAKPRHHAANAAVRTQIAARADELREKTRIVTDNVAAIYRDMPDTVLPIEDVRARATREFAAVMRGSSETGKFASEYDTLAAELESQLDIYVHNLEKVRDVVNAQGSLLVDADRAQFRAMLKRALAQNRAIGDALDHQRKEIAWLARTTNFSPGSGETSTNDAQAQARSRSPSSNASPKEPATKGNAKSGQATSILGMLRGGFVSTYVEIYYSCITNRFMEQILGFLSSASSLIASSLLVGSFIAFVRHNATGAAGNDAMRGLAFGALSWLFYLSRTVASANVHESERADEIKKEIEKDVNSKINRVVRELRASRDAKREQDDDF